MTICGHDNLFKKNPDISWLLINTIRLKEAKYKYCLNKENVV